MSKESWLPTETELATRYFGSRLSVAKFTAKKIAKRLLDLEFDTPLGSRIGAFEKAIDEILKEIKEG